MYIFLSVAIGLGANQLAITATAFATIVAIIWIRHRMSVGEAENRNNLFLNVATRSPRKLTIPVLTQLLEGHCIRFRLKRADITSSALDASFLIEVDSLGAVEMIEEELRQLDRDVTTTIIDYRTDIGTT